MAAPTAFFYAIEYSQVCNFADDNTIFARGETLDEVAKCIVNDTRIATNWFRLNEMVANPEKFQLIFFGLKEDYELSIEINGDVVKMSDTVKLLGIIIDSFGPFGKIFFQNSITLQCKCDLPFGNYFPISDRLDTSCIRSSITVVAFLHTNSIFEYICQSSQRIKQCHEKILHHYLYR